MQFDLEKRSILALGDITEVIPDDEVDIAVLEEPEHLTWYHHGKRWKIRFRLVVGIVHTNYVEYVRREKNGLQARLLEFMNSWVVDIYCHKVIRLSAATQNLPRSIVCNVHGVNPKFLEIGTRKIEQQKNGDKAFTKGAYYIGKMVWSKGYKELLKLLQDHQKELAGLEVHLYGSGEDSTQIQEAAKKLDLTVRLHPGRDHGDSIFHDYKVLLNPSTTDVVCTTSAEALAMGKIVVCANHPSNDFFKQFPNCRTYDDGKGFVKATSEALAGEPLMLTDAQRHELSWEAATERFLKVSDLEKMSAKKSEGKSSKGFLSTSLSLQQSLENASAFVHFMGTSIFGSLPDEEQQEDLGLSNPSGIWGISSRKWTS
ncbi:hypothetical protein LIER_41687 [Lithospermum erythrorhizon]|uniref:Digalactosyldiacylglycerol synthase 2, chloroplastic n=1 Tax=Lithospermum erythrorhizon TaxID=34254 RepID=A0AAV3RD96_LITER